MSTSYMIEPCCADRQAPMALQDAKGRAIMWTNGDVTVRHWYRALAYLVGQQHILTIVVREPDVQLLRWMKTWMLRGWVTAIQITCAIDAQELIMAEFDGLTDKVTVAIDNNIQTEIMMLEGEERLLVIAGPMLTAPKAGITTYAVLTTKDGDSLQKAIAARHRSHNVVINPKNKKDDNETNTPEAKPRTRGRRTSKAVAPTS